MPDINPKTGKPWLTEFNRAREDNGNLQLLAVDPRRFSGLGKGRACPSCIDLTSLYLDKQTGQRVAVCRICGRTFNA